jgi:hypothetical protein
MLNSGNKIARPKKNILTLALSGKKILNEKQKTITPPYKLNGLSLMFFKLIVSILLWKTNCASFSGL